MKTERISIQTEDGVQHFSCILRNEEECIYEIVDANGKSSPRSVKWQNENSLKVLVFNGLKIHGGHVYTISMFSLESYLLGTVVQGQQVEYSLDH